MAMYGLASAPPHRFSTRRASAVEFGTRRPAVRLSYPQCMLIGAVWYRVRRRYELTFGQNRAMAAGRYLCRPAMCEKKSCDGVPSGLLKMLLRVLRSMTL